MDVGIEIAPSAAGEVPEYECREAAVYVGVSWQAWLRLGGLERGAAVAHYRTQLLIKAHIDDAAYTAARRAESRRRARGGRTR